MYKNTHPFARCHKCGFFLEGFPKPIQFSCSIRVGHNPEPSTVYFVLETTVVPRASARIKCSTHNETPTALPVTLPLHCLPGLACMYHSYHLCSCCCVKLTQKWWASNFLRHLFVENRERQRASFVKFPKLYKKFW